MNSSDLSDLLLWDWQKELLTLICTVREATVGVQTEFCPLVDACSLLHVRSFGGGLDLQLGPGQVLQLVAAAAGRWPHLAAAPRSRRLLLLLHNELQLLGGVQGPLSQGPLGDLQAKDVQHHVGAQPAHQGGGARGVVGLPVVEKEAVHLEGRRQGGGGWGGQVDVDCLVAVMIL